MMKDTVIAGCCSAILLLASARSVPAGEERAGARILREETLVRMAPNELIEVNVAVSPSDTRPRAQHEACRVEVAVAFSDPRQPSAPPLQAQKAALSSTAGEGLATFAFDPGEVARGDAAVYRVTEQHRIERSAGKACAGISDLSLVNKDTGAVRAGKRLTKAQVIAELAE